MTITSNVMTSDATLKVNHYLVSNNQRFFAILQSDGNFCVYFGSSPYNNLGGAWWALGRSQPESDQWLLNLQHADGDLVVNPGPSQSPIWSNGVSQGPNNYFAVMQDDGLFCEYVGIPPASGVQITGTVGALWSSGTDRLPGSACASPPIVAGINLPWRDLTLEALGKISKIFPSVPTEVGSALSAIVGFFWPTDDTKGWVTAMIREAIGAELADRLSKQQTGLLRVYNDYKSQCTSFNAYLKNPDGKDGDKICQQMYDQFIVTLETFNASVPEFMPSGYELETVTLMAVVATMHLYLYRDGLLYGAQWGASDDELATWAQSVRGPEGLIATYCDYVDRTVQNGLPPAPNADRESDRLRQWIKRNSYVRNMTINVLDSRAAWPFLDPQVCPLGQVPPKLTREIYSDPFGIGPTPEVNLPTVPPGSTTTLPPTAPNPPRLTAISVDGDAAAIWGVTVAYDDVSGPRMGGATKGGTASPYGLAAQISASNPIVGVSVTIPNDDIIQEGYMSETLDAQLSGMMLVFQDGTTTGLLGQQASDVYQRSSGLYNLQIPGLGSAQYPGHVLSSITVVSTNVYGQEDRAGGVVFGFRLADCWS